MVKMECQKSGIEALERFQQNELAEKIGYYNKSANLADEASYVKMAKFVERNLLNKSVRKGDKKVCNESSNMIAGLDENCKTRKIENTAEFDKNSSKICDIIRGSMEESPIKVDKKKLKTQDPLIEINLGSDENKWPTYISAKLLAQQQEKLKKLLIKYNDCFA